ncbi:hypothetical protein EVAR_3464_1 [Eumeta japonica]|uniref:Uncharacterized protein n=1 Tax=Eumeta variegata TaxID=151549 RepID=A0A4C1SVS8_EUMVA|nr:hypothetical protein EVAR_3464_1 [Eumeta japonica]
MAKQQTQRINSKAVSPPASRRRPRRPGPPAEHALGRRCNKSSLRYPSQHWASPAADAPASRLAHDVLSSRGPAPGRGGVAAGARARKGRDVRYITV